MSGRKFREILRYFAADLTALQIASLTVVNRNTVNGILRKLRSRIAEICKQERHCKKGLIEFDECYFGPRRVKGKRGRGAAKKILVFGIMSRDGKVYVCIIESCSKAVIFPLIRALVPTGSILFTDGLSVYHGLGKMSLGRHYSVLHGRNEFAKTEDGFRNHINGIEGFWGMAKVRLAKFRGMDKRTFYLHLKECEFRYNHRNEDIYKLMLRILKKKPLF